MQCTPETIKMIAKQVLRIKSWIYESATEFTLQLESTYTEGVAQSLCRLILLDIVIVNCP